MKRDYRKWYSPRLERDMEILVHGHAGARVIVFPSRLGRFYDFEDHGMVEVLRSQVESGGLQLFCVDSVDEESFYCSWKTGRQRLERHMQYERYILDEVLPLSEELNPASFLIAHGCSLGAFHAMNIALRHPQLFGKVIAFSGRFDLTSTPPDFQNLFDGYYDEEVYFNTPTHFLPNLTDEAVLQYVRKMEIILAIGDEDPFFENNQLLSRILWEKGAWNAMHIWQGRAHRFRYWRQMAKLYF
ncbi:MAG TPA: alpha/beta hydrolase-fold protein [Chthoniobacterales bacterium]